MSTGQMLIIIYLLVKWTSAIPYENEYGDDYGVEWLYYISDNGTRYTMNFSTIPRDTSGLIFGDVYYNLYTRNNRNEPEKLTIPGNGSSIDSKYFNQTNDIKVVTHGWMSSDSTQWLQKIKDGYLEKCDYNVITVDWSEIAGNPTYVWPALSTRYVGKTTAKMLQALVTTYEIDDRSMHLIGHSLGAQVMGYTGMFSQKKVNRITGLDPARPLFEFPLMPPNYRLERSDATFVDIIHSCGGVYGYRSSHGHADFYPNGGKPRQPGCEGTQATFEACSHGRACEFFEESIFYEVPFTAYPCESWKSFEDGECQNNSTYMGEPASVDSRGDYYLKTNNASRYAQGEKNNEDKGCY